jgi:hypothetical protein
MRTALTLFRTAKIPETYSSAHVPDLSAPVLQRSEPAYGSHVSQLPRQSEASPASDPLVANEDLVPSSRGQPLEPSAVAPLEQHFRADLSDVRIHTGVKAAESATNLDALAYTSGRDIYFAPGMYAPSSTDGQRLLAHEVAHIMQQNAGKVPATAMKSAHGARIGAPEDILEVEAEHEAQEFMSGSSADLTEEERKKYLSSGTVQRAPRMIQRQQAQTQSTTSLDATAQSIIRGAGDTTRDVAARAVEAVWRIIHQYYSGQGMTVNVVTFDNTQAGSGLATGPYPASNPTSGRIFVGDAFLRGVQDARSFAHRVLQVGHELEHINQFKDPHLGPSAQKKDEREFLAFYHEALATEVPHTGRFRHSTRILVIDQALGYYNCLTSSSDPDKQNAGRTYAAYQQQLLARRSAEIADMMDKGYTNVPTTPARTGCQRQP